MVILRIFWGIAFLLGLGLFHLSAAQTELSPSYAPTVPAPLSVGGTYDISHNQNVSRYEECSSVDPNALRTEMATRTLASVQDDSGNLNIDIAQIVAREWRTLAMDTTIKILVQQAVEEERTNSNYWERLRSGWDTRKAKELADKIANRAFGSEDFLQALEQLSTAVSETIALQMDSIVQQSASASLLCVQEFIGQSYGVAVQESFNNAVAREFQDAALDNITPDISTGVGMEFGAQTGVGVSVIIITQVSRHLMVRLGQRLSQRLAGKIASRLASRFGSVVVPVVGWVVGIGLIVFDLIDGNAGAFAMIEEALTSPEVSQEIQREVVEAVSIELPSISADLAREVSEAIYAQWNAFLRKFRQVLHLAQREPEFKNFLDSAAARDFDILATLYSTIGEQPIMAAVANGNLLIFLDLPYPARVSALELLKRNHSLEHVLAWWNLTGSSEKFNRIISYRIPQYKRPDELTKPIVDELLNYTSNTANKLILLPPEHMERFLQFSTSNISQIMSNRYSSQELFDFSILLGFFENQQDTSTQNRLIQLWADSPEVVSRFSTLATQRLLLKSHEPLKLINFIAGNNSLTHFYEDAFSFANGNVPWQALRAKYAGIMWLPLTIIGALALIIFWIVFFWLMRIIKLFLPRAKT